MEPSFFLLHPVVDLVALQFLLYAAGWGLAALMLRDERTVLAHWSAFLLVVGLAFVLVALRDGSRLWWTYNLPSLCWAAGLLLLWRGLAHHFGAPLHTRWQSGAALLVLAVHLVLGPGQVHAVARVLATYGANAGLIAMMMVGLFPTMIPRLGLARVLLLAASAFIVLAANLAMLVLQLLAPEQPLEVHRPGAPILGSMMAYLVAAALFNFTFMALVVARLLDRLRQQSERDALTGLYNRRAMTERLAEHWALWQREGRPFSLALVDLDHFKRVNDTRGHPVGDEVLVQVAQRLRAQVRGHDMIARVGGEEFVVLMPRGDRREALALAERLCAALRATALPVKGAPVAITASIGVAMVQADDPDADAVLRRADAALYRAKAAGRDQVADDTV